MYKSITRTTLFLLTAFLVSTQPLAAQSVNPVSVELIAEQASISAGQPFWLGIQLNITKKWHIYWKNPGDAGMPPTVEWDLPEGFEVGHLLWPSPERFVTNDFTGYGYHDNVMLLVQVRPPKNLKPGTKVTLRGDVQWVACSDQCVPGWETLELEVPVTEAPSAADETSMCALQAAKQQLPKSVWIVTARQDGDEIELDIRSRHQQELLQADFIPDGHGIIDDNADQTLIADKDQPGHYTLRLKRSSNAATEQSALSGLLVLREPLMHDENMQVLALELPFDSSPLSNSLVAAAKPVTEAAPASGPKPSSTKASKKEPISFAWALILAFVGGLFLNLMPCVLPVISLKLMHFIKIADKDRRAILMHGLSFCFGVLISLWTMAAALIAMRAYGHAAGWGFQLQDPRFVAFMAVLLFVFTLSLWGVYEFGMGVATQAGKLEGKKSGVLGTFLSGVLATLVATPCTAPGMASALPFALSAPWFQAVAVFTALGVGLSFPYLLCSAFPKLISFLPKPGAWMNTFKQLMGFFMAVAVLWMVWTFGGQTGVDGLAMLLLGMLFIGVACWIYGHWAYFVPRGFKRVMVYTGVFAFIGLGFLTTVKATRFVDYAPEKTVAWEKFSEEKLAQYMREGRPVFVDFTAKWCVTCQANKAVLRGETVSKRFENSNVVRMVADWTRKDKEITDRLQRLGREGVPVYALFDPEKGDDDPKLLTSYPLTSGEVIEALDEVD